MPFPVIAGLSSFQPELEPVYAIIEFLPYSQYKLEY
jgi:hypothetical protein